VQDAARRDPEALLRGHDPLTLGEVQREASLLTAVKRAEGHLEHDERLLAAIEALPKSGGAG
jgi:hypothetical protein